MGEINESAVSITDDNEPKLTDEELEQAKTLSKQLTVDNQTSVLDYGKDVEDKLSSFSDGVLVKVQNKDLGEIGDSLRELVTNLNETDPDKLGLTNQSKIMRFFNRVKSSIFEMTAKYQQVSVQIDRSAAQLKAQEESLINDNKTLDEMYKANFDYYQSLNVLIAGGKIRLKELDQEIADAQTNTSASDQMGVQRIQDLMAMQSRLDKRVNDLALTRQISIQQAPQIRLIQNTNEVLAEKIQSSINTAIPLWKNQVTIALTLLRQKDAVSTQMAITDATNDLLKKNSAMLKQSTIDTAKASERGVVDIDTLKETQNNLIGAVEETIKIQQDGSAKRRDVEDQLKQMETDLQVKLSGKAQDTPKDVTPGDEK
ncbi:toxic anion resistance protein [Companilactobacillus kimchii]|uniref:Tellurite resistance protein n=2 Tax=Companilactobacillus kimchii TaxID=2801452 RepID=A0ABR5NSA9_9LACO|nr:toxic anion resistance protein [Companilactobacillus kimchii]KAE9557811.1 tellurite resistance protein TelA [Companilactobacillus kimchii]KRK50945.1 tellurite resistance protein [Companilactobacillus kimchii DSM 13961 = JCM 10707]OWF33640.1 TelA-like protein [Companilactobacillus kimchii]GEO48061.1 tellurite resistance protein [Companilactobacillus paralimentarius]